MSTEDAELRRAHAEWFASRPTTVPARRKKVLEGAEQRLLGAIKHSEPRRKLVANAERVRQAQLGLLRAQDLVAELPTDVEDEQRRRHRENLAKTKAAWESMPVDDIIGLYTQRLGNP